MAKFTYVSLRENLSNWITQRNFSEAVIVFPNKRSRDDSLLAIRRERPFAEVELLSMEEFKENFFLSDKVVLSGYNRVVALYSSMNYEVRDELSLSSFFQFQFFAERFFNFFEELSEEMLSPESVSEILAEEIIFFDQKSYYDKIIRVRELYRAYLEEKGFTDKIFVNREENVDTEVYQGYNKFCFVNQFYYTGIEKELIKHLEYLGREVEVVYQLPPIFADKLFDKGSISKLSLNELLEEIKEDYLLENLEIYELPNNFFSFANFLERIKNDGKNYKLIDVDLKSNPYINFLSPECFNITGLLRFIDTSLAKLLSSLADILSSVIEIDGRILIPINEIFSIFNSQVWTIFLRKKSGIISSKDDLIRVLQDMIERDFKYVDLELRVLNSFNNTDSRFSDFREYLKSFIELIKDSSGVLSFKDFINLFDSVIITDQVITEPEAIKVAIKKFFYEQLSELNAIEDLRLVNDWFDFLGVGSYNYKSSHKKFSLLSGFIRLFLHLAGYKTVPVQVKKSGSPTAEIINLLDSRNLSFKDLIICNVNEGVIPSPRNIPFILNESQRKRIGLKTYEDIVIREKYYFFRTVLNSKNVIIYTTNSLEDYIVPSSFTEELKINIPASVKQSETDFSNEKNYFNFYNNLLISNQTYRPHNLDESFFNIPFDIKKDHGFEDRISLTYYNYREIKRNPFLYYLQLKKINENQGLKDFLKISPRLIGIFAGDVFDKVWDRLNSLYKNKIDYDFSFLKESMVETAINNILANNGSFFYKLPHNYHYKFFYELVIPRIIDGVKHFFYNVLHRELSLSGQKLFVRPEFERASLEAKIDKIDEYEIYIKGRPDLIIEDANKGSVYIFDYKTGTKKTGKESFDDQLLFYELIYNKADNIELSKIHSLLYWLMEPASQNPKYKKHKTEAIVNLKKEIEDITKKVVDGGYTLSDKKIYNMYYQNITRYDLYNKIKRG